MAIQLLEAHVIDQIAAGEVVERPASVVKELVENALDAGAKTVEVWLRNGGINRIRIVDDGSGMDRHDALLSIERHATSKIRTADDLVGVSTLGFRGEALPSIASVSKLDLTTRTAGSEVGTRIRLESGRLVDVEDAGCAAGTEVDVRALFGAIPARRKFLRAPQTEQQHCLEAVLRVALIRPDVAFRVHADDREALDLPRTDAAGRVRSALGADAAELLTFSGVDAGIQVDALIAPPSVHRAAASGGLYLYVGGRVVRDVVVRRAVLDAWRDLLPRGRYPVGVVRIDVPAGDVDVNVHPSKVEVRFRDPAGVTGAVIEALRKAADTGGIRAIDPSRSRAAARADDGAPTALPLPGLASPRALVLRPPEPDQRPELPRGTPAHPDDDVRWSWQPSWLPEETPLLAASPSVEVPVATPPSSWRTTRPIGLLGERFLLAERSGMLVVLDRTAIDEHRLRKALADGAPAFALVAPVRVPVGEGRAERLLAASELLSRWGFALDRFGPREVVALSVPAPAAWVDVAVLLREVPLEPGSIAPWLAARSARPGSAPTPYEQRALLLELEELGLDADSTPRVASEIDVARLFRSGSR
jgi:DNA mismatch repair protein MutL